MGINAIVKAQVASFQLLAPGVQVVSESESLNPKQKCKSRFFAHHLQTEKRLEPRSLRMTSLIWVKAFSHILSRCLKPPVPRSMKEKSMKL